MAITKIANNLLKTAFSTGDFSTGDFSTGDFSTGDFKTQSFMEGKKLINNIKKSSPNRKLIAAGLATGTLAAAGGLAAKIHNSRKKKLSINKQ